MEGERKRGQTVTTSTCTADDQHNSRSGGEKNPKNESLGTVFTTTLDCPLPVATIQKNNKKNKKCQLENNYCNINLIDESAFFIELSKPEQISKQNRIISSTAHGLPTVALSPTPDNQHDETLTMPGHTLHRV